MDDTKVVIFVAALTSAVVGGIVSFFAEWLKSKKELSNSLLHLAVEVANKQTDLAIQAAKLSKSNATLLPVVYNAAEAYAELNNIYRNGKISDSLEDRITAQKSELDKQATEARRLKTKQHIEKQLAYIGVRVGK